MNITTTQKRLRTRPGAWLQAIVTGLVANFALLCPFSAQAQLNNATADVIWTGKVDADWANPGNWAGGFVPGSTNEASIPSATPFSPVITAAQNVARLRLDPDATVTIRNTGTLTVSGNLSIWGAVEGKGYLRLNGSSQQHIAAAGIVANLELANLLGAVIEPGSVLGIRNSYLPTEGLLTTNGNLVLLSDSNTTASVLAANCGIGYIDGDVTTLVYISGGNRTPRFLGHPFSQSIALNELTEDVTITGNSGNANDFTSTASNVWYPSEGIRISLSGAKGESNDGRPHTPGDLTLSLRGPLNQCDVAHTLSANLNTSKRGYSLISNPYPAAVELTALRRDANVGESFYVWDPRAGSIGEGAYIPGSFTMLGSFTLPAYAGVLMYTEPGTSTDHQIVFTENMKTTAAADNAVFSTTGNLAAGGLQLQVFSNNGKIYRDRLYILFDAGSSALLDKHDACKFVNPGLNFYTLSDTGKLSIDVRPLVLNSSIPLGLRTNEETLYTIRIADYDVNGTQLYLIDKFLNQSQALAPGTEYHFTVTGNPLSQGDNRFEIGMGTTAVAALTAGGLNMTLSPNPATETLNLSFDAPRSDAAEVTISNMLGQQVCRQPAGILRSGTLSIPVSSLTPGVYIVTLHCGEFSQTQRFTKQ